MLYLGDTMNDRRFAFVLPHQPDLSERWNTNTLRPLAPLPPLGVLSLGAVLEREGWEVAVFDNAVEQWPRQRLLAAVLDFKPNVVGLSMTSVGAPEALALAPLFAAEGIPVVAGGPHPSVLPREVAEAPGVVAAVVGEAEETIDPLAGALADGRPVPDLPGVHTRDGGDGICSPPWELDSLPNPARHLVEIERYSRDAPHVSGGPVDSLASTRGCPFRCTFCSNPGAWGRDYRRHRGRSAERVADEMEHLASRYGSRGFFFREDNFTANRKHVLELCDEFEKRGFSFPWKCEAHVSTVNEAVLARMVDRGLKSIWFGVESGSDRMLKRLRKGFTAAKARELLLAAKRLGLRTASGFLLGLPGQTEEDIAASVRLAEETEMDDVWFQVYVGYPGSDLYDEIREQGMVEAQWHSIVIPRNEVADFAESARREEEIRDHFRQRARARRATDQ